MISAEPSPAPSGNTVPVPLAALEVDGTAPAAGDEVTFSVTGRLVSAEGETGSVEVTSINGQPVSAPMDDMAQDAAMMKAAEASDREAY